MISSGVVGIEGQTISTDRGGVADCLILLLGTAVAPISGSSRRDREVVRQGCTVVEMAQFYASRSYGIDEAMAEGLVQLSWKVGSRHARALVASLIYTTAARGSLTLSTLLRLTMVIAACLGVECSPRERQRAC
jgi:hypothetical protein